MTSPGEVIFSNVLLGNDGNPYWLGDGRKVPEKGFNYSGGWFKGKKYSNGNEISHAHKNARYTVSLQKQKLQELKEKQGDYVTPVRKSDLISFFN